MPHEHELATGADVTAAWILAKDRPGVEGADAMLAILDGPSVDDGTACEIGMFHALMQSDRLEEGDRRPAHRHPRHAAASRTGVNLFVQGVIEDVGEIVDSFDAALAALRRLRSA